jgi:hypothetical protein
MPTQIEMLRGDLKRLVAEFGPDDRFVTLLRQQLQGMELNEQNRQQRFLAGSLPASAEAPTETEEDAIRAEGIRREKVRRMAADALRRSPDTLTETSRERPAPTRGSSR